MPGRPIRTFTVLPHLPDRLQALHKLAYNLWWCWNHEAVALFRRIDADLFEALDNSPVKLLGATEPGAARAARRRRRLPRPHGPRRGGARPLPERPDLVQRQRSRPRPMPAIAYFSAEFGIHESVPIYSGGLGVLAGDHLKSASDLGLPLVGVGLMYREGYFRQYLNVDGWQQERYPENDFFNLPLIPETDADGTPLLVTRAAARAARCSCASGASRSAACRSTCSTPTSRRTRPEDRAITARLYGGDHDMRIRQEMVLGIGGIRALRALGKMPTVCHMNEGHSAFCGLERIRVLMEEHRLDFAAAREAVDGRHLLHHAHAGPGRQRRLRRRS